MKNSSKIIIGIFVVACVIGIISSFFGNAHNINKMATLVGTSTKINIAAIAGVTAPVTGVAPVTNIAATTEYTAIISWSPTSNPFAASTVYKATITITPKVGYTLSGVGANFFTVAGATATNSANSGIVTAMFPATAAVKVATKTTTVYVPKSIVLKLGEKNVMVAVLQRTLVKDGFFNYPITGVFDKNTLIAVEALQKANKLPITGYVRIATRLLASSFSGVAPAFVPVALGVSSTQVAAIQSFLITKGDLKISAPTTYFGAATQAAVKLFQKSYGLSQTGIVDQTTFFDMNKL